MSDWIRLGCAVCGSFLGELVFRKRYIDFPLWIVHRIDSKLLSEPFAEFADDNFRAFWGRRWGIKVVSWLEILEFVLVEYSFLFSRLFAFV